MTIYALSTGPGISGIAIVRVSGAEASLVIKKLTGGEELFFDKYKWGKSKRIFWEDCPWHQKYFDLKFPFIHKYDGNIKHCLVDFHNN